MCERICASELLRTNVRLRPEREQPEALRLCARASLVRVRQSGLLRASLVPVSRGAGPRGELPPLRSQAQQAGARASSPAAHLARLLLAQSSWRPRLAGEQSSVFDWGSPLRSERP